MQNQNAIGNFFSKCGVCLKENVIAEINNARNSGWVADIMTVVVNRGLMIVL